MSKEAKRKKDRKFWLHFYSNIFERCCSKAIANPVSTKLCVYSRSKNTAREITFQITLRQSWILVEDRWGYIYIYNTSSSKIPSEAMWQYLIPLEERDVYKLVKFQVVNEDTGGQCLRPSYPVSTLKFSAIFLPLESPWIYKLPARPPAKEFNFERYTIFRVC